MRRLTRLLTAVSLSLLAAAPGVALAAPTVGPEFELDVPIITSTPAVPRSVPQVAYNGSIHLAAFAGDGSVRARRLDSSGTVLDATDIVIDDYVSGPIAIASDGQDFLLAYESSAGLTVARVAADGSVSLPTALGLSGALLQLVRGSTGYLLLQYGQYWILDGNGQIASGPGAGPPGCWTVEANYANPVYLVSCVGTGSFPAVKAFRVDEAGAAIESPFLIQSGTNLAGEIGSTGAELLVLWNTDQARRIGTDGTFVGGQLSGMGGHITFDGSQYLTLELGQQRVRRFSTSGLYLGETPFGGGAQNGGDIAGSTSGALAVHVTNGDLRPTRVNADGSLSAAGTLVSSGYTSTANQQLKPEAATNANGTTLVVWDDYRSSPSVVYGAMVDSGGSLVDDEAFFIDDCQSPQVASDGSEFLVACHKTGDLGNSIALRHVDAFANVGPALIHSDLGSTETVRALASSGTEYLLVYTSTGGSFDHHYLGFRTVNPQVTQLGTKHWPPQDAQDSGGATAIWGGAHYFVVWGFGDPTLEPVQVASVRVTSQGVADPLVQTIAPGSPGSVIHAGTDILVTVRQGDVWGAIHLSPDNLVVDPAPIPLPSGLVFETPDGPLALVQTGLSHVQGVPLDASLVAGPPFEIVPPDGEVGGSMLAGDGTLFLSSRYDAIDGYRTHRIRARRLGFDAGNGDSCVNPDDCGSGFCVEGVCCETACESGSCTTGTCEPTGTGGGAAGGAAEGGSGEGGAAGGDGGAPNGGSSEGGAGATGGAGGDGSDVDDGCMSAPGNSRGSGVYLTLFGLLVAARRRRWLSRRNASSAR